MEGREEVRSLARGGDEVGRRVGGGVDGEKGTSEVTRLGAIAGRAPKAAEEATAAILG